MVIERMVELHKNKFWKKNIMLTTVASKRDKIRNFSVILSTLSQHT